MQYACIKKRCQQVVGQGHCMGISGEVEVEIFHRDALRVATACGPSLNTEHRTQGRLAYGVYHALTQPAHGLTEPDGRCGLAFAQRGGSDSGDHYVLPFRTVFQVVQQIKGKFGFVLAVILYVVIRYP